MILPYFDPLIHSNDFWKVFTNIYMLYQMKLKDNPTK